MHAGSKATPYILKWAVGSVDIIISYKESSLVSMVLFGDFPGRNIVKEAFFGPGHHQKSAETRTIAWKYLDCATATAPSPLLPSPLNQRHYAPNCAGQGCLSGRPVSRALLGPNTGEAHSARLGPLGLARPARPGSACLILSIRRVITVIPRVPLAVHLGKAREAREPVKKLLLESRSAFPTFFLYLDTITASSVYELLQTSFGRRQMQHDLPQNRLSLV